MADGNILRRITKRKIDSSNFGQTIIIATPPFDSQKRGSMLNNTKDSRRSLPYKLTK